LTGLVHRVLFFAGVILMVTGVALVIFPAGTFLPSLISPAVDVVREQSGLAYEYGIYFFRIVLHSRSSEPVVVVAVIKTGIDFSPRRSNPIEVCPGCTVTVRVDAEQPPSTQSQQQNQKFIDFLTRPEYVRVESVSSPIRTGEIGTAFLHRVILQAGLLIVGSLLVGLAYKKTRGDTKQ
jgi:hypothetical protein